MTANEKVTATSTVCIPWRATPERKPAFDRVKQFWTHHGFKVVTGNSPTKEPFNVCKARNKAVRQTDADNIIVADADTIPDIGAVYRAIETLQPGRVVWPFTKYRHIPADTVTEPDLHNVRPIREYAGSVGGLFICQRETFWDFGGMDERFHPVWGYDDTAFHLVVKTLGDVQRIPAYVYSFDQGGDHRDMSNDNPNKDRFRLYSLCDGKPALMRELIRV